MHLKKWMNMSANYKIILTESFLKKEYGINKLSVRSMIESNIVITMDEFSSKVVKAVRSKENIDKFFK